MAIVPQWLGQAGVIVGVLASFGAVRWLDRSFDFGRRRRSRLLLGLPWGTLVSIGFVLGVYLFIQGGLEHWHDPLVVPFRSWSYFYPLGVLTSSFAHTSAGHLLGNLFSGLVLAALVEYAWGHFPTERGTTTFARFRTNPYVRAFVLFPAGVLLVGLVTGVFGLGPVAGFSVVVYAFAGFALVRYPLGTVVALTFVDAVQLVYRALQEPVIERQAGSRFIEPWWAGIALQGHLLGILIGALLGVVFLRRRDLRPNPSRLWIGAVLVAISMDLWIVWWYRGNTEYVLYRVVGLWLVVTFAVIVVLAATSSDREFPDWVTIRRVCGALLGLVGLGWIATRLLVAPIGLGTFSTPLGGVPVLDGAFLLVALLLAIGIGLGGERPLFEGASRADVARLLLVLPLVFTAVIAIPTGFVTVDGEPPGETTVEVGDYTVTYAENVTNGMVSVIDLSLLGETTSIRTSGVIVINEERRIWTTMASTSRLAFTGDVTIPLGGVGWRETVEAQRAGWSARGGPATYVVFLRPGGGNWSLAHTADRAVAEPTLAGYRVGVRPGQSRFVLNLIRNGSTVATRPIPATNESVTARGITFVRDGRALLATYNGTRIQIAAREQYR